MVKQPKAELFIPIPPVAFGFEVPLKVPSRIKRWFRPGSGDIVDRLYDQLCGKEKVKLKICSYTLQTTLAILLRLFGKMVDSKHFPDVELMILRPDLARPLRIWDTENDNDMRYWKAVCKDAANSEAVKGFIKGQFPRVTFTERFFPFDPCVKAVIVNDLVAFFGLYVVEKHQKKDKSNLTALDYLGTKTELTELSDRKVLNELITWFDRTWSTLT